MSMYAIVHGQNPLADVLLATLGLTKEDTGRFRDVFVADGKLAVYTRNGGGNREDYGEVISVLQAHELYESDADDDFDCTYATFYFRLPEQHAWWLRWTRASSSRASGGRQRSRGSRTARGPTSWRS